MLKDRDLKICRLRIIYILKSVGPQFVKTGREILSCFFLFGNPFGTEISRNVSRNSVCP